jgi:anhydro-N-acetylmuramic acid kinase
MRVIGLMSGTSMDGIDAALIDTDGEYHIERIETASISYDKDFKSALKELEREIKIASFEKEPVPHLMQEGRLRNSREILIQESTKLHAHTIEKLLQKFSSSSPSSQKIDLIGYHGQTIYHHPAEKITLQIGDPHYLANQFNIPVIYDFRTQDILHGGQGAPLAPLYHQALMIQRNLNHLVMINCGGIANISIISGKKHKDILGGFDTGPGNVLLDKFVREWTHEKSLMDCDGLFASLGQIDFDFLEILYQKTTQNNYYQKRPPKSLDSQDIIFIPEIINRFSRDSKQNLYNGCATLAAFTALTIVRGIPKGQTEHWVMAGGGAKNPAILDALKSFAPENIKINTANEMGWSTTYMEAELMAWLSVRSFRKLPLTIPQTTGVKVPMTGGQCAYPQHFPLTKEAEL